MVPAGVLYFFLWYVPPLDDEPEYAKYIYYQILYLAFQASLTVSNKTIYIQGGGEGGLWTWLGHWWPGAPLFPAPVIGQ